MEHVLARYHWRKVRVPVRCAEPTVHELRAGEVRNVQVHARHRRHTRLHARRNEADTKHHAQAETQHAHAYDYDYDYD